MYRIAICNDNEDINTTLIKDISSTMNTYHIDCVIDPYSKILTFYKKHLSSPYQLLIIHTDFNGGQGVQNCQFLRQFDFYENIIILSSSTIVIDKSFDICPLCYLSTPIDIPFFHHCLLYNYYSHTKRSLSFHNKQGVFNIPLHEIRCVESKKNYLYLHTNKQTYRFKYKIDDLLFSLNGNFIRCHQSFIVNLYYIESMQRYSLCLDNQISIPISKKYSSEVRKKYQGYLAAYSIHL